MKESINDENDGHDLSRKNKSASRWGSFFSLWSFFPETDNASLVDDPQAVIHAWRDRALTIIVVSSVVLNLPALIAAGKQDLSIIPDWASSLVLFLSIAVLCVALIKKIDLEWRIFLAILGKASIGILQYGTTHLIGSGRLSLMMLPVTALILAGPRLAGNFFAFCVAGISIITGLFASGLFSVQTEILANITPGFWVFQAFVWLGNILPHMYLMVHLLHLQEKIMMAVRSAKNDIDQEIARNRRLESEIDRIGEIEKQKLGAELHDGLCQHLTATLLNCSALEYQLKAAEKPETEAVRNIREAVEKSISMAYEVARGLCPVQIQSEGLIPALQQLCLETRRRHKIRCQFKTDHDVIVSDHEKKLQLYRIVGEAVSNAVRHSNCSCVEVSLKRDGNVNVLEIFDDGRGIDPDIEKKHGMGMSIMEYRASLIGGTLETKNNEKTGFSVICRFVAEEISHD